MVTTDSGITAAVDLVAGSVENVATATTFTINVVSLTADTHSTDTWYMQDSTQQAFDVAIWVLGIGLTVKVEFDGQSFIAEDLEGHTYGHGASEIEAVADWREAVLGRFQVLLNSEDALAPHLGEELESLKNCFQKERPIAYAA